MELVRVFALPFNVDDIHYLGDGTLLGESTVWAGLEEVANQLIRPPTALVRFDLGGSLIDSIGMRPGRESYSFSYEDNAGTGPALFGREAQMAAQGSRVFYGSSDLMQVEELSPSGSIARILRIPDYPLGLTDGQVAAERASRLDVDLPPGMTLPLGSGGRSRRCPRLSPGRHTPTCLSILQARSGSNSIEAEANRTDRRNGSFWMPMAPGWGPFKTRIASALPTSRWRRCSASGATNWMSNIRRSCG